MLVHRWNPVVPPVLREPSLLDSFGLPRFWATVWSLYQTADLASATKRKQLGYVEAFYLFSEGLVEFGALDDAIARVDLDLLGEVLEAYFISLRNQPTVTASTQLRWRIAFQFVRDTLLWLSKSNFSITRLQSIQARLERLDQLYAQLQIGRKHTQDILRALPATVVQALYEMLDPTSSANPFRDTRSKWRAFIVLNRPGYRGGCLI